MGNTTKPSVWIVSRADDEGSEPEAYLVIARTEIMARRLLAATCDEPDESEWRAVASVAIDDDVPKRVLGVWDPSDEIMATYGLIPSDDWRQCPACAEVSRVDTKWTKDGDDCDDCYCEEAT